MEKTKLNWFTLAICGPQFIFPHLSIVNFAPAREYTWNSRLFNIVPYNNRLTYCENDKS